MFLHPDKLLFLPLTFIWIEPEIDGHLRFESRPSLLFQRLFESLLRVLILDIALINRILAFFSSFLSRRSVEDSRFDFFLLLQHVSFDIYDIIQTVDRAMSLMNRPS